ncbi:ABC transporter permease [Streptomyces omiyaensis]|uniref:Transport permease protein n=1 Tax=Streptomyces omiyaensis TaxID=68247 RepID=A0ABW7BV88_9ACTN|nr:ABC transporter permease [Streptomyces omiyaensis]GGY73614.1 transport permease protein [Streptomyces omiyaensis]
MATTSLEPGARLDTFATQPKSGLSWWLSDAWQMALRNFRHLLRSPELVMFSLVQPIMFILLFAYVFGGAINVQGGNYPQFLLPGILVQMVLFGSVAGTTIGVSTDMSRGLMDRFRSMPMSRSAVLVGRSFSEIVRNVASVLVVLLMGLLIGFRFQGGFWAALGGVSLLLLFGYALTWVGAMIGLSVANPEAAQSAGLIWIFPFSLISSAFVPTGTMPSWLQVYAEASPMTTTVNALRALFNGEPATDYVLLTVGWSIALVAVFAPLATRKYSVRSQ